MTKSFCVLEYARGFSVISVQREFRNLFGKEAPTSKNLPRRYHHFEETGCLSGSTRGTLGIAQSVISRLWQRFQDDSNVSRCYSTGQPRVTTPNADRHLAVTAKRNRRSTTLDLSRQLSSATGTTVSRQTMYRRLGHIGLYARRPVRCVPLTQLTFACD
ncbi:HTH_Tnp_Tc3_2 domain-containing protein [Trichonephila clavipes]|uniref:HTH_Tnp_Tc3_2 domain-containing protein n=1 Tax=Trichonephila clavipes TaxID=2585209 RepID=A0A8X6VRC9_TRICX|nr:HTH_Tnp_Tc3_2 domain-containing protein [Trichonephila clavipes]